MNFPAENSFQLLALSFQLDRASTITREQQT